MMPEVHECSNHWSGDWQTAFEPALVAQIATGEKGTLSIDNNELWVHDAEWQEKEAFDLEI